VDVCVGKDLNGSGEIRNINSVTDDELILDIGTKSTKKINSIIEKSSTILWNGPAGYFENPNFAKGSIEIAKKIVEKNLNNTIFSVAGGGDTVAFLNGMGVIDNFNFVSTAGGAFLEYLEGKNLPGIRALN
jgi:phosphoglycerate kinase